MADFPGSLYTKTTVTDSVTSVLAAQHNDQEDEILAIETELGTDPAGSKTNVKERLAVMMADDGTLEFADSTILTISSGAVTVTQNFHRIATEGGAGSDYLTTINGLANDGALIVFRPSTSNDIIADTGADNITCVGGSDITFADTNELGFLLYDSNLSTWICGRLAGGTEVDGDGTTNYVAKFTGTTTIDDSTILDDGSDVYFTEGFINLGNGTIADPSITFEGATSTGYLIFDDSATVPVFKLQEGRFWIDSGAQAQALIVGNGDAGVDYYEYWYGQTNQGERYWMEGEDRFEYADDVLMRTTEKFYLRDTGLSIHSSADGELDITTDGNITLGDGGTTNYANFAADGELTLAGTARVKQELGLNAANISAGGSGVAINTDYLPYIGYDFGIGDNMYAQFEIPPEWDTSTDLEIKIYWAINEAYVTNSGEVQWAIDWKACPTGGTEAIDAPTHTGSIDFGDQDIPATAKYLTKTPAGTIAAASLSAGDLVGLDVNRVILDGGSNPTDEPILYRIEVEYTINKLGEAT